MYSSNCPISRPVITGYQEDGDFNGLSWSNKHGIFIATENELLPIKSPPFTSIRPPVRGG